VKERSDAEILAGLIERSRLLIAIDDDMPVEIKLQTQPLLKQLEQLLADEDVDVDRVNATHAMLVSELSEYADLDALLSAMRHFLPE
jgi:hypothetical protein